MGHIAGARAIREAAEYKEVDARVATVAVHLGLISDAHKLFVGCAPRRLYAGVSGL